MNVQLKSATFMQQQNTNSNKRKRTSDKPYSSNPSKKVKHNNHGHQSTSSSKKSHQPVKASRKVKPVTNQEKIKDSLKFYRQKFGFGEPFNVLFDAQFLMNVVKEEVDLTKQLQRVLQTENYQCYCPSEVLNYLRSFKDDEYIKAVVLAKKFQRVSKKKKQEKSKSGDLLKLANQAVIEALGDNNHRKFIVANGESSIRSIIFSKFPQTPTLRVIRETIAIDAPSKAAKNLAKKKEEKVVNSVSQLTPWEREQLAKIQQNSEEPIVVPLGATSTDITDANSDSDSESETEAATEETTVTANE